MHSWRKVVIWLVLVWLPVQGYAAGAMPFACAQHDTANATVTVTVTEHGAHQHAAPAAQAHHEAAPQAEPDHTSACDNCNLCQLCGALALPVAILNGTTPQTGDITARLSSPHHSFIPALPLRPPRTTLA
jgi:hypothetical protein